jgi:hypothetical protein
MLYSKPYVEGSCVTDPCWYAVANATGKEVVIFDLYPETGTSTFRESGFTSSRSLALALILRIRFIASFGCAVAAGFSYISFFFPGSKNGSDDPSMLMLF